MNFSFRRSMLVACAAVGLAAFVAACNKDLGTPVEVPASGLMVFNLAPDQEAVGVALSGNAVTNGPLQYTNFNGRYQNIYTGQRDIQVYDFLSDSVIASGEFNFENGNYYSLFVTGNNGEYGSVVVQDEVDSSASAEKAYIRYINAIPDSSSPVVTVTAAGANVLESAAPFNTVSPFTAVDEGEVGISVNNGSTITANRNISLEKGKVYTALLIGDPSKTDSLQRVQIRFIENGLVPAAAEK